MTQFNKNQVYLDWGRQGALELVNSVDTIVIADALGGCMAAEMAAEVDNACLWAQYRQAISGSALFAELDRWDQPVFMVSLRNMAATAEYLQQGFGKIGVVAVGDQWPDQSCRQNIEDYLTAGGFICELGKPHVSPQAELARSVFASQRYSLKRLILGTEKARTAAQNCGADIVNQATEINSGEFPVIFDQGEIIQVTEPNVKIRKHSKQHLKGVVVGQGKKE